MKILLKRNSATTSSLPAGNAGEPIWFKDKLYIGSTGQTGITSGPSAGDLQRIVWDGTNEDGGTLTLSTTAATYLKSGPYQWKIKMPDTDPYTSARTPSAHNHAWSDITSGTPTTLAGYGITDANIASGVITLGSNTITPLTSWAADDNYAFKTVTIGKNSTAVTNPGGASSNTNLVADSSTDTLTISPANKWIRLTPTTSSDKVTIGHIVGTIATDSGTFQKFSYDEAGHITAVKAVAQSDITGLLSGVYKPVQDAVSNLQVASLSGTTLTFNQVSQTANGVISVAANSSNTLTFGSAPSSSNYIATKAELDSILAANDAMVFKGTIGSSGATVTELPATGYSSGWTYKVLTAGTYAGNVCEIGDMIVCVNDYASGTASNSDWSVIQTNIDGAVIGPASSTDGRVALFNGTSGKSIKVSDYTIGKSVPSDAVFTDEQVKPVALSTSGTTNYNILLANNSGTPTTQGKPNYATSAKINGKGEITASKITINSSSSDMLLANGSTLAQSTFATAGHDHSGLYQPVGNYKTTQTAVSDPTASGNATSFISTISQDTNGVITATKASIDLSAYSTTDEKVTPVALSSGSTIYPFLTVNNASTPTTNGKPNYRASVGVTGDGNIMQNAANIIFGRVTGTTTATDALRWERGTSSSRRSWQLLSDASQQFVLQTKVASGAYATVIAVSGTGVTFNASTLTDGVTAKKFVTNGGTSSQFVKGDGSLDSTSYATASHDHSGVYQPVGNYKTTQTAVSDPTASGTSSSFISSISQDTNGVITASKANLPTASTTVAGITTVGASGGAAAYDHSHSDYLTTFNDASNYAFKTIAPANSSSVVTALTGNTTSLVADSNTDTLNVKGYNKWIVVGGSNTGTSSATDTLNIAHHVGTIATDSGTFRKFSYDEAGHITAVKDVAWSDITGLSGYTDNNDTYTFSTTATNGKFSDSTSGSVHTITLTEIDGGTF